MTEAIFGLIGVIIGALVTGLSNLALERRKERAAREAAATKERIATQVAARLVRDDLVPATTYVEDVIEYGTWLVNRGKILKGGSWAWDDQRTQLASVMTYADYAAASEAAHAGKRISTWISLISSDRSIDENERRELELLLGDLRKGLELLKKVAE